MPTLQNIYNYIFRNEWANPEYQLPSSLTPEARALQIKARKAKMKSLFDKVIAADDREKFRAALRSAGATHLETELYGNTTDSLKERYKFPVDYEYLFNIHNNLDNYFKLPAEKKSSWIGSFSAFLGFNRALTETKEEKTLAKPALANKEQTLAKFKAFFQVCKIIADFIEHNNTRNDTNASYHAFVSLVVFGDQEEPENYFKSLDRYLKKHNYLKEETFLHDALVWGHPKYSPTIHLDAWRKIIQETGAKAFQLFQRAAAIGAKLGSAPTSYLAARKIAHTIAYKNSEEDPELADLFIHYNVSEDNFNRALELQKNIKETDNLPTIVVNGADLGFPRYYLVKLPPGDPRAFVLGYITNCCQSIGGNAEECAIDGATRPNNGFLLLVKERIRAPDAKSEQKLTTKILTEAEFNIKALLSRSKMMGQGYMWKSILGNLCIDSWENLNPTVEDDIAVKLLEAYAHNVVTHPDSQIGRVCIGLGGKTPQDFKFKQYQEGPEARENAEKNAEKMLEGTQYPDSFTQYTISYSQKLTRTLDQFLGEKFPDKTKSTLNKLSDAEHNYSYSIMSVLNNKTIEKFLEKKENFEGFSELVQNHKGRIWSTTISLIEAKLCNQENLVGVFSLDYFTLSYMDSILNALNKVDLLNQDSLSLFLSVDYQEKVASLDKLHPLLKKKIFDSFAKFIMGFANLGGSNLLNKSTLTRLVADIDHAIDYNNALGILQTCGVAIDSNVMNFLLNYGTDSTQALQNLHALTGGPIPDIYQHIRAAGKHEFKKGTLNYTDLIAQGKIKMDINLILDAASIIAISTAKPSNAYHVLMLANSARNGNLLMLETLYKQTSLLTPINTRVVNHNNYLNDVIFKRDLAGLLDIPVTQDNTYLMLCAATYGHSAVVDFFIKKGANVNLALHIAIQTDLTQAAEMLLIEKKAEPTFILPDSKAGSCLQAAVNCSNIPIIELLLNKRADIDKPSSALYLKIAVTNAVYAMRIHESHEKSIKVIKFLIENKAKLDQEHEKNIRTYLTQAVTMNKDKGLQIAALLLDPTDSMFQPAKSVSADSSSTQTQEANRKRRFD